MNSLKVESHHEDDCEKLAKPPLLTNAGRSVSWEPGASGQLGTPVQFVQGSFVFKIIFIYLLHFFLLYQVGAYGSAV